jgi:hypothetical protein
MTARLQMVGSTRATRLPAGSGAFAKPPAFVFESLPMSHRFYAYFFFFSRLAAEGTG